MDTTAETLNSDPDGAKRHLRLARRITRHSFTEARRAVTDLRTSSVVGRDLSATLSSSAHRWIAGSKLSPEVQILAAPVDVSAEIAQNVLRIAQEAVTNTMKHAQARSILLCLESSDNMLRLRVKDDGSGFAVPAAFDFRDGHFGILGMGERAQRFGGSFKIESQPGQGTEIDVTVPLTEMN